MAIAIHAQVPAAPEIRGTVLESSSKLPVAGADVLLYYRGAEAPKMRVGLGLLKAEDFTRTDANGEFSFSTGKVGYFSLATVKDGFSKSSGSTKDAVLTKDQPVKDVQLLLVQPGGLTGKLVDAETGEPLANIRVSVLRRSPPGGVAVRTGADGVFIADSLEAGEYSVRVEPQVSGKERIVAKFTEADAQKVDEDLALTVSAIPAVVSAGATVNMGRIEAKKAKYYRVRVHVAASSCGAGDTMQVYQGMQTINGEEPCRSDMLITGFAPGPYKLILAVNGRSRETREMASVPFVVADKSIEISAALARGTKLDAKFIPAEGARPPDYSKIRLRLASQDMIPFVDIATEMTPDAEGVIHFTGVPAGGQRIVLSEMPASHYVQEIRYNGIAIDGVDFALAPGAMQHALTFVLDDKPASLMGRVMQGDKPVSRAWVVLAKWPMPAGIPPKQLEAGEDGRFQIGGLAPGEYRAVAYASRPPAEFRMVSILEQALSTAGKVEVARGSVVNVTLEVR